MTECSTFITLATWPLTTKESSGYFDFPLSLGEVNGTAFPFDQKQLGKLVPPIAKMVRDIPDLPALPHFLGVTSQKSINLL